MLTAGCRGIQEKQVFIGQDYERLVHSLLLPGCSSIRPSNDAVMLLHFEFSTVKDY